MQIIENMEELLTVGLPKEEELNASTKSKGGLTELQKYGFELMFEFSDNPADRKIVEEALNAPLKVEEEVDISVHIAKREKEAKKSTTKSNKVAKALEKLKEESLKSKEVEIKEESFEPKVEVVAPIKEVKTQPKVEVAPIKQVDVQPKVEAEKRKPQRRGFTDSQVVVDPVNRTTTSTKENIEPQIEIKTKKHTKIVATKEEKPYVDAINDQYILTREEYLEMLVNKSGKSYYITQKPYNGGKYALVDSVIIQHLRHERTIGVFAGKHLAKFICFDVDNSKDLEVSKVIAADVIDVLVNIFKIDRKYIVTSFSGNKGYHVEILFDKPVDKSVVKRLYKAVLPHLKPFDGSLVELRPTGQGLKVPLSVHKVTGKVCNYVDDVTFEEIGKEKMLNVIKMPIETFQKIMNNKKIFSLSTKKAEEMEKLIATTKPLNKTKVQKETDIVSILSAGRLVRTHSRHDVTFRGAAFLFSQGQLKEDTKFILKEIIDTTWLNARHLIDAETTKKIAYDDIEETTNYVYDYNVTLEDTKPDIVIYQSQMERIFELPKIHLKQLAFSFLQHSTKFAKQNDEFYMTYSSMTEMGNAQNRQDLLNSIIILEKEGFLKIVARNVISKGLSIEYGRIMSEPNRYKLTIPKPSEDEPCITLKPNKKVDLIECAPKLMNRGYIKSKSTPYEFNKYFKI